MDAGPRCLALALILAACGPGSGTASDEGSGTDGTDGTGETGTTPTTGGTFEPAICPGTQSVDPFQAVACEEYAGEDPGAAIEVGVVNMRDEVVYLRGFGNGAAGYLRLSGVAGGREVHAPFVCSQEPPFCDEFLAGEGGGCLASDKLSPAIRIEAGTRVALEWTPRVVFEVDFPESCGEAADGTCTVARRVTPGAYEMHIAYNHADGCTGTCTCEPDSDGNCVLDPLEATLSDDFVPVSAPYDGVCTVLDLVIE